MTNKINSREERIIIINSIIKEISERGRKFFHNEGKVVELIYNNGKIYYKAEWGKKDLICLTIPKYTSPKGFFHGGTLLRLMQEFRDYITTGIVGEEEDGYWSGLYSPHWGYPDSDMIAIQNKAKSLGYLK